VSRYRALAAAKVNLGLFLGPVREHDSRHALISVMQSVSLADVLELTPAPAGAAADELQCAGVAPAQNLAARALARFREQTGWDAPPLRLRIDKRIPIAAGLAGGSADAAATLRLARAASGLGSDELLAEIARGLGADVPAQLAPGRWLAGGAGESLERLPAPAGALELLLLPCEQGLSTAAVFAEADRLGLPRGARELEQCRARLAAALAHGEALPAERGLLHNDLQAAALSLRPQIAA
jgi:4-diphosphocytidyl-2-C-methyl-D-erythritol kinase